MAITDAQFNAFIRAVDHWSSVRYMSEWNRMLADNDADDVDADHAEADRLGVEWRKQLDALVAGTDLDPDQIAHDIHAWGAAEAESARRSAMSCVNPGRPQLGALQLDGENDSLDARQRWVQPLVELVDGASESPSTSQ